MEKMKTLFKNKKFIGWLAFDLILVAVLGCIFIPRLFHSNEKQSEEYTWSATDESMESYIRTIVEDMFVEYGVVTMTEEEKETLTAMLNSGVLNSLPSEITTGDTANVDEIRKMIEIAVNDAIESKTVTITEKEVESIIQSEIKENNTVITNEIKSYIEKTVVPNITAMIQINAGKIEDLQNSLKALSDTYNSDKKKWDSDIAALQEKIKTTTDSPDLKNEFAKFKTLFENYKSETSASITSLEAELAELEAKVQQLIDSQIDTLRNSLIAQIEANKDLSDEQKADLQSKIDELANNAATAEELGAAVAELTAQITQSTADNQAALTDAINNLLGDGATENITIAELEQRIDAADISPEQKQELLDAISAAYGDATADTILKVGEAKEAMQKEIDRQAGILKKAVEDLQTDLEKKLADLEVKVTGLIDTNIEALRQALIAQINANKELTDGQKAELEGKITELAGKAATSEELGNSVADLLAKINQSATNSQTALNNAIESLLGDGATEDITIAELEERIAAADISEEQKQILQNAIQKAYNDATADTIVKVGEAKTAMQEEIDKQIEAVTKATGEIKTALEAQIGALTDRMVAAEGDIGNLSDKVTDNEGKIGTLDGKVAQNESDIGTLGGKVDTNKGAIDDLTLKISDNKDAQDAINDAQSTTNSNLQSQIDGMSTDVWVDSITIPASSFMLNGSTYDYVYTNSALKANSDVTIGYADTSIKVVGYEQGDGTLTIKLKTEPTSDIVIKSLHIQNRPTN